MKRLQCYRLVLVALGLGSARDALATDGLEPIGVSTQANARGGADIAVGDTALSQIENPAALGFLERRVDFTTLLGFSVAPWQGPLETADSHTQFIPMANFGVAWPGNNNWTAGVAVHSKAGLGTAYEMRHLLIPFVDRDVGGNMKCVDVQFNLARRWGERLSLGGGVRLDVAQTEFSTVLGPADLEFGQGRAVGGGFQLGALYKLRNDLSLGVAYRSPTWASDLHGGQGKATLLGVLPVPLGDIAIADFRLPQRLGAGIAWDATERLKLIGEVRWLNYAHSSLDVVDIETHGWLDLHYPLPLGYRDQWAFIAGAEYRIGDHWVLGGGYHYATAPVDAANLLPMGSTISEHHITTGLRYEQDNWWVGVGYVLALPTTLRGSGHSRIPLGVDYGFSEIEQTQHILGIGFGFSW